MADKTEKTSAKKSGKKKDSTISQIIQIYRFTAKDDRALPWFLAGALIAPIALAVIIVLIFHMGIISAIMTVVTGIMLGILLATITLTRRSDKVGYKRMESRTGATGAVLNRITRGGFNFPQDPVWIDMKTKDAVWRGSGRTGVYLVGEGDYGHVMRALDREESKIKRITRGSDIPIYKISVGHGEKQVPLKQLQRTVMRKKVKLTKLELGVLNERLTTLQQKSSLGVPKGIDPTKVRVNRRAMRGR
ncbi:MAG: DUF4191 domain-containing protein [Bifidobacterium sp.]|uniref:DUF4191 domain-containing protein n=1 Tax=Bifidobacterium fermentum TaxID=3059035 RepID=A0AB39UGA7_9BIFI